MKNFFTAIRRINSLLLFGGLIVFTVLVLWGIGSGIEERNRDVVATAKTSKTGEELRFRLEEPKDIPGTDTQMLKLTASKGQSGIAYSGYERDARNILFLSGDDKAARWLFPNQDNVIHTAAQLLAPAEGEPGKGGAALALYFVYSDQDTSGDGEVTKSDRSKLALAKADGEGFANVLSGIDHVYSVSLTGERSISILYRLGKSLRHARYAVATLGREFDREVVSIPGVELGR